MGLGLLSLDPFELPNGPLLRDAVDPVDALVVSLPRGDPGGTKRDVRPCGFEGSEARALDVGHSVLQDEGVPHLVMALPELLNAGHPDLCLPEFIAHPVHLTP